MAFIHDRRECLTACQEHSPWSPGTDLQVDLIMVYGLDDTTAERIRVFRSHGYVVHLMTGCAWGDYRDYLDGAWDGTGHWDESQCDRRGEPILHGVRSPYLCPTPSFSRYLLEKLKPAVDAGVEAIHLEEPEFWDAGGYSPAFRRAWEEYYGEPWQPPDSGCTARSRSSFLKAFLFRRLLSEVGAGLKAYARERGKNISFYVATHSLINYSQWKILSPESSLLEVPAADGFIAQVWTGTARVGNVWQGRYAERPFETAFLEYGALRELSRGTGKRLWFLHDPVEDNPACTWESFRELYLATVAASLMIPDVFRYEVAPWPDRIFHGVYPKQGRTGEGGLLPGAEMEGARPIPPAYAELICTLARTLGDMEQPDGVFEPEDPRIGLLIADSALCERSFPDGVPHTEDGPEGMNRLLLSLKEREAAGADARAESTRLMRRIAGDSRLFHDYAASGAFPHFFGLAMPLVKAGIPLHPVQLDNLPRVREAAAPFSALILSDEWMKPGSPRELEILADWVLRGGTLLFVGDGSDPYHAAPGWWNTGGRSFRRPAQYLFHLLGLPPDPPEGVYPSGGGKAAVLSLSPARLTLSAEASERYLSWVLTHAAPSFEPRGFFLMKRGPYRIAAVMEETSLSQPLTLRGLFADLFSPDYDILGEKTVPPGRTALLFDLKSLSPGDLRPVASTARLEFLSEAEGGYALSCLTAEGVRIRLLMKLPRKVFRVEAKDENGRPAEAEACRWHEGARTLFLSFPVRYRKLEIRLYTNERQEE